ncbi:type II toxin-antitoxin system VapC family toxin [Candidatus Woesearchaeota archaeon]|nr:type II toxin-antitoxin system VapC family toxin [Candidatus Woesearchaeota archaeon]
MLAYIDSNVLIFAGTADNRLGDDSRRLIKSIIQGNVRGITASLTFDEVFYQISKSKKRATAITYCENFLALPNLEFLSVNMATIEEALELLKKHNLEPRDAIHAAIAFSRNADWFVTEDAAFSKVAGLKAVSIEKALKEIEERI